MMKGEVDVVIGWKIKLQTMIANVTPSDFEKDSCILDSGGHLHAE